MAHESFEDADTAALMNELFVNIKVDREERPDVDAIYMTALQELGEQGGWPLTMFLTPDGSHSGRHLFPAWSRATAARASTQVLENVARVYANEQETIKQNTAFLKARRRRGNSAPAAADSRRAVRRHRQHFIGAIDPANGGLRGAPKFPNSHLPFPLESTAFATASSPASRR